MKDLSLKQLELLKNGLLLQLVTFSTNKSISDEKRDEKFIEIDDLIHTIDGLINRKKDLIYIKS